MRCIVHPDKISKYLLDLTSVRGASKARFFLARGFSVDQPDKLEAAMLRHALEAKLVKRSPHPHGYLLVFECEMEAFDGSRPCIRSVWLEQEGEPACHLVTAYPMRSRP